MKLVPCEPTEEMIEAGVATFGGVVGSPGNLANPEYVERMRNSQRKAVISHYKAMIAAAPAEPDPAADPVLLSKIKAESTPRTDKEEGLWGGLNAGFDRMADFARQLECDLATCHAGFEVVKQQLILALRHKIRERERAEKAEERVRELEEKLKLSDAVSHCLGRQVQIKDDDRIFFRDKLAAAEQERDALAKDAERLQRERDRAVEQQAIQIEGRDSAWHYIFKLRTKIILLQAQLDQRSGRDAT